MGNPIQQIAESQKLPESFDNQEEFEQHLRDPRRCFQEDTGLWQLLLLEAAQESEDLFYSLHVLRSGGAKLDTTDGELELQPRFIDPEENPDRGTAWDYWEDWELDCEDLLSPHVSILQTFLSRVQKSRKQPRNLAD